MGVRARALARVLNYSQIIHESDRGGGVGNNTGATAAAGNTGVEEDGLVGAGGKSEKFSVQSFLTVDEELCSTNTRICFIYESRLQPR